MYHLLRKQISILFLFVAFISNVHAQEGYKQLYRENHDDMPYYFGMTLGYNSSYLAATKNTRFLQYDSILSVEPGASGGISLGLLATLKLNDFYELRVNPQLVIGGSKYFTYTTNHPLAVEKKTLNSTIVSFPIHLKFNSDRLNNFRTYLLGGVKFDMDLASNSAARNAEDLVKLKKNDFAIEAGIGFNFYLPFVTVSPEIKFSYGLTNIHSRDPNLKYSNVLEKLQSRMIVFSLHLED